MTHEQAEALIAYAEAVDTLVSAIPNEATTPEMVDALYEVHARLAALRRSLRHLSAVG